MVPRADLLCLFVPTRCRRCMSASPCRSTARRPIATVASAVSSHRADSCANAHSSRLVACPGGCPLYSSPLQPPLTTRSPTARALTPSLAGSAASDAGLESPACASACLTPCELEEVGKLTGQTSEAASETQSWVCRAVYRGWIEPGYEEQPGVRVCKRCTLPTRIHHPPHPPSGRMTHLHPPPAPPQ